MSDNNIISEFNNLGVLAQKLEDTGRYDVGMLISVLKHQEKKSKLGSSII